MFEDLCNSIGEKRIEKIAQLSLVEIDHICNSSKHCEDCPLALFYLEDGEENILCLDYATETRVNKILRNGGYFKTLKGI